ncbi:MAG: glycosyltransferase [Candidimonas sp.]|nr:MAG: glycosyltransferase [Candidimonas sp.]TAM21172.1 MAG: glycosyltransferase [Candidimonas sp.]TAM76603.1 MAG: glycosyltransferase [Candidimonas sp.]
MTTVEDTSLQVVHIISGLGLGGAETVLHRLVTASSQASRSIVISLGDDGVFGPRLRAAGIDVYCLNMRPGRLSPAGVWRLYRLLRQIRPDVVQTWMYHADLLGGVAARLAGIGAVSWGIRNSGANLRQGSRSARALAWVCARLSGLVPGVIVSCAQDASLRHQEWGYRADRMLVIPNGYDLSRWRVRPQARIALRTSWGLAEDTPLIGSVARWNPLKDHANLLRAFALSLAAYRDLRCVLVGLGMDDANAELAALMASLNVRDKVILLGPRDDVPDIMSAIDVHVLSSCAEGFPNVVAEAMAAGALCVVTDVGDAASIVADEGWIAPARNPAALSEAMNRAVAVLGSSEASGRTHRGRERVRREYSLDNMVAAYQTVWQRLADDFPSCAKRTRAAQRAPRLLYVVNNPAFFLSHRLALAMAAKEAGFDVHVATMDGPAAAQITAHGLSHHVIPMTRSGKNPLQELHTLYALWHLYRRVRPDLVHAVTIKPVLYGGIAARLAGVPAFVAAVSGLGFVFTRNTQGFDFVRQAAVALYRLALGHSNSRVIFQNANDCEVLSRAGIVRSEQVVMVRGSGVDLNWFRATPEPRGAPVAIMVSRLLRDKGVCEFVAAARASAGCASGLRWVLVGSPDPGNPASISAAELELWQSEGVVECMGEQTDIASLYAYAHIAVLPSYREGLPKSLIEAAACARAVVTTDVPGCRDAIEPDVTGLLVPARDAAALAAAVQRLADDAGLRRRFGAAGRELAEREFDIRKVVRAHLDIYQALIV